MCGRQSYSTRGVREPGEIPGLTRSGEGDGRGNTPLEHAPGRCLAPVDPESEDLLALVATVARSHVDSATGSLTR